MHKRCCSANRLVLLALTLGVSACPKASNETGAQDTTVEKSLPGRQLDDAKAEIDAATKALQVKANQVGEASVAK